MSGFFRRVATAPAEPPKLRVAPGGRGAFSGSGDYRTLDIVALFTAHGLYGRDMGDGKHAVQCPNAAQHSDNRRAEDSDTVIYEARGDGFPGMHCLHSHCVHLDEFEELLKCFPDVDRFCAKEWAPTRTVTLAEAPPLPEAPPAERNGRAPLPLSTARVVVEPDENLDDEPLPILDGGVQPFPLAALPYPVQQIIREGAVSVNAPPDFIAIPTLVAMASAIGNSRCLRIKPNWTERAVLWGVVVGRPGSGKTPAAKIALAPIRERQRRLRDRYLADHELFEEQQGEWEQELEGWKRRMAAYSQSRGMAPGKPPVKPKEPEERQVYTTNTTLEALNQLLYRMPRGILLYQDEIAGLVSGMNAYRGGKGGDLQAWLELWNSGDIILNRRSEKTALQIQSPFVCVSGSTQPDVVPDLLEDRDKSDGFIDRFLFCWPDPLPRRYCQDGIAGQTIAEYQQLLNRLFELDPDQEEPGQCEPKVLHFTESGQELWNEWSESHFAEMNHPDYPPHLEGLWMKLFGYTARLALVLHCARYVWQETDSVDVDRRSVWGAAGIISYFKSHAQRVYTRLRATTDDHKAAALLDWLGKRGGTATARDIYRNEVAGCRTSESAVLLMRDLANRGHAELENSTRGKLIIHLREAEASCRAVGQVDPPPE